jgi:hypothetical protein
MGKIDNLHHPENQRQPDGYQGEDPAVQGPAHDSLY